jgi:hypothetical protein
VEVTVGRGKIGGPPGAGALNLVRANRHERRPAARPLDTRLAARSRGNRIANASSSLRLKQFSVRREGFHHGPRTQTRVYLCCVAGRGFTGARGAYVEQYGLGG